MSDDPQIHEVPSARPRVYANHVNVQASAHEVCLKFGVLIDQQGTRVSVQPVADVYLTRPIAQALLSVLERATGSPPQASQTPQASVKTTHG